MLSPDYKTCHIYTRAIFSLSISVSVYLSSVIIKYYIDILLHWSIFASHWVPFYALHLLPVVKHIHSSTELWLVKWHPQPIAETSVWLVDPSNGLQTSAFISMCPASCTYHLHMCACMVMHMHMQMHMFCFWLCIHFVIGCGMGLPVTLYPETDDFIHDMLAKDQLIYIFAISDFQVSLRSAKSKTPLIFYGIA